MEFRLIPEAVPRQKTPNRYERILIEFEKLDVPSARIDVPSLKPDRLFELLTKAAKEANANIVVLMRGDSVYLKVK